MTAIKNDRLLRALRQQKVDRTPIWIMRQAGRYLPEYRRTRARAGDFLTLCKTPELACEVTVQPLERFPLDAAILFSDILTIPDAMGLGLTLDEGIGPRFLHPIRGLADIRNLSEPDVEQELAYVMDAVRLVRQALDGKVPLIGFSGSPWTLTTYMVEGGSSKNFSRTKGLIYDQPGMAQCLLDKITSTVISYLKAQVAAGVQALMVFDTWGGVLSDRAYREFSLRHLTVIAAALKTDPVSARVPLTFFTKGGGNWLEDIAGTGCDCIGLDWTMALDLARQRVGGKVALQGNMDPAVLYASADRVVEEARRLVREFGPYPGHIFNLGHGISPDIDPGKVAVLVDAVHQVGHEVLSSQ